MGKEINEIPCLYCGKKTTSRKFIINPKAKEEMPCCSSHCMNEVRKFIEWDSYNRMKLYVMLFIFVALNLIILGFDWSSRWRNAPIICIAISVYFYPLIFTRYIRYQKLGIKKTIKSVKAISIFIVVFNILLML